MAGAGIAAIVTAAGMGRRLAPLTDAVPKPFLPVAIGADGRPETALSRLLRQCGIAGLAPLWLAGSTHPWFARMARRYAGLHVAVAPPGGECLAVIECLRAGLGAAATVVVSGDNVVSDDDLAEFVAATRTGGDCCLVAVAPADDTRELTLVREDDGRVAGLVEKPALGGPGLGKAGLYFLGPSAVRTALTGEPARDRFGEASMTELLLRLMGAGVAVRTHRLRHGFRDIGTVAGLSRAVLAPVDPEPVRDPVREHR